MKDYFQQHPFTVTEAAALAASSWGIKATASRLTGENDANFRLEDPKGKSWILKISPPSATAEIIDLEMKMAAHLAERIPDLRFPVAAPDKSGRVFFLHNRGNAGNVYIRLLQWIPGRHIGTVNPRSDALRERWGEACGKLSQALQDFDHPAAHRFYEWDPSMALHAEKLMGYLTDPGQQKTIDHFLSVFRKETLPRLGKLRKSINYNDAHERNLLVNQDPADPEITGIIDLGDAVYTHTVNEVAIACAYAMMDMADPLAAAASVVRGYHRIFVLTEKEVSLLYSLITARLVISVLHAARNRVTHPENTYLQVSARPAWETLEKLRRYSPALAHFTFREACGREPVPQRKKYDRWLEENKHDLHPVVNLNAKKIIRPDLAIDSSEIGHFTGWSDGDALGDTLNRLLSGPEAVAGIGGYGEVRPFYTTDIFSTQGNSGKQWRTVHLGTDLWVPANTRVMAPMEGRIHSFRNNRGDRNYGPTIILEHQHHSWIFYTLYGHLTTDSLVGLKEGAVVGKGEAFARVGTPRENGNWPSHLHFQVILDLLDHTGDFPGACTPETAHLWMSLCPSSEEVTGVTPLPPVRESLSIKEILTLRHAHLGPNLSVSYREPLYMVRGQMQYLLDHTARRYLDTVNNVAHVGHEHPRVVHAAQQQIALLNTNTRYLNEHMVRYAEALLSRFPEPLSVVYFVNSGSEAIELALRMTENFTGHQDMMAVEMGYHGNTGRAISLSSYKFDRKGGKGSPSHTHILPMPDTYRGKHRDPETAGRAYASYVQDGINTLQARGKKPAGFICESILSCGGQIVLPRGYLKNAYAAVRHAGGVCIADEVQVGFGRVGQTFWGFQLQEVIPDIVTIGKPMGNGHPIGAVVTTRAIAEAFDNGMEYFNTYGGNPVSCAIGHEVLRIIHDEGLQQHALETGNYLKTCLEELKRKYPVIGDVRGYGLFLGMELVKDREKRTPATAEAAYLINRMRTFGILMSADGPDENVIKIKPPMCIHRNDVNFLTDTLDDVLREDVFNL